MSFAASSSGLRTGSRGATNVAALEAQHKEILRQNNPSAAVRGARGCAALLSCGCVRKHKRQESDTSMSDMPSARTLHGHIHDARDQPTPNANGTVRERNGRTKKQRGAGKVQPWHEAEKKNRKKGETAAQKSKQKLRKQQPKNELKKGLSQDVDSGVYD